MDNIITVADITNHLRISGITYDEISTNDLDLLITSMQESLMSELGISFEPVNHTEIIERRIPSNKSILLNYYPVTEISEITLNNLSLMDYTLDEESGIIYLLKGIGKGLMKVKYTTCISDSVLNLQIKPLLKDLIAYKLDNDAKKGVSSIEEGEVTVSFDNNLSVGTTLMNQINSLKASLTGARVRMI